MKVLLISFFVLVASQVLADNRDMVLKDGSKVKRIEVGSQRATNREMIERIRFLEQAVYELQNRIYDLEDAQRDMERHDRKHENNWSCSMTAMGQEFLGVGSTRALAQKNVFEECKRVNGGNSFLCRNADCKE